METDNKPMLSVDTEGNVLKCAKGAEVSACGYTGGALCAKCGAKPVMMKMVPLDETSESKGMKPMIENEEMAKPVGQAAGEVAVPESMSQDEKQYLKMYGIAKYKEKYGKNPYLASMSPEEMKSMMENTSQNANMEEEQEMAASKSKKGMGMPAPSMDEEDEEKMYGMMMPKKKKGMLGDMPMDEEDDMTEEEKAVMSEIERRRKARGLMNTMNSMTSEKGMNEGEMSEDEEEDEEEEELTEEEKMLLNAVGKRRQARGMAGAATGMVSEKSSIDMLLAEAREHRIQSMGLKWDDLGEDGYICSIERKSHSGGQSVCADCEGGCLAEKGLPGLLHVEGLAEQEFKGIVIDSGYSAEADMFVVDVQVKDGSVREVYIDGTTAEIVGFHKLDDNIFEQKSAVDELMVISFVEAAEIAIKSIDGTVIAVEPDVFEGIDSYAVEIDGFDGKSYDVFVGLDGEVLGYDRYEPEEAEDIEAEAAEIALKKAFSEDRRMSMAKEGMAMPDGSYPIESEEDLKNAIQAYGRAKDKEATRRHIMKRAKDMGKESMIPSAWVVGGGMSRKDDSSLDAEFMKSLIEFELLQSDEELS